MKNIERWTVIVFIFIAFLVAVVSSYTATQRVLTTIESVLLQLFSLSAGLVGSYIFGKQSSRKAAKEIIKPHARSAFRRLLSLFKSLSRVAQEIQDFQNAHVINEKFVMARIDAIVIEQLATADDALEDWRDIVPEEVEEILARHTNSHMRNKNG